MNTFHIYFILFLILSWIYAIECMEVIPERANYTYFNPKYISNVTVNVRRYQRKSRYYINVLGTLKYSWSNNVTVTLDVSQFLHNEYRPSFVQIKHKYCDLINYDPFFGVTLKNAGLVCPLPSGYHAAANISAATELFPNVFPFEKGRMEFTVTTNIGELVVQFYIVASFKQKRL